ncbi:MAG: prephenate dehydrogenase/arogenate dehydrogenase family protein [Candidatus Gastranaerophilales bacterium]|nr:prephenate dehydrogenase/arogenate dehydrogenase family protein [Candidatus Gastranaerophilales bacterium]
MQKIGIISLGLIGGSILKSLSNIKNIELFAYSTNDDTINKAKKFTPNVSSDLNSIKFCDVIFVCSPISKVEEMLQKLNGLVNPNTIVTDVASVKSIFMNKTYNFNFIGSHPMAGTEHTGFDYSKENMFNDAKWVITPKQNENIENIETLKNIITYTNAKPIIMDANEHDLAVALISHMPLILSQGLFSNIENNNHAKILASSGFRDMTRLAMSNTQMAFDMLNYNRENIDKAFDMLEISIKNLINDNKYSDIIQNISENRKKMYDQNGVNNINF